MTYLGSSVFFVKKQEKERRQTIWNKHQRLQMDI